jgi:eukaryotic-like serine/threonine-protein kinase
LKIHKIPGAIRRDFTPLKGGGIRMAIINSPNQRSAKEIFLEALEQSTPNDRVAYLDAACGQDPLLRQRVVELLAHHFEQNSFMQNPAVEVATVLIPVPTAEGPGSRIGRYKLLQLIGEGGMGVVYMAEQEEPVHRRVALKIIRLGLDTKHVVARFEAERQALALMDHPNFARVLDGGATETGRPYFVMELVPGVPITEFCDKNQLSVVDRLKLLIPVCQAIQSAHQKGIIHRDLKPSNILVTLNGSTAVPKVIDFGVAKATNQKLTEKTLFTNYGTMIGTPAYMSPEQAEMTSLDVDTRADIYGLGVLLYELLTGTTPFPETRLRSVGYSEMQRIIVEERPERPSTRLSTMHAEQRTVVAKNLGVSALTLSQAFASDLDWIVMKCLEKDRARRYETANGMAMDLQRHLNNEPVLARPPSRLYEFQKTVQRHKVGFAATAAVITALATGVLVSTWQFVKERTARQLAVAAEQRAETISRFLKDMLKGVDPIVALGRDTKLLRDILDKTAERIGKGLTNQPSVEAELLSTIGQTYNGLGEFAKAEEMHREALRLRRALFGETNQFVAASLNDLANDLLESDKYAEATTLLRQALAMRRVLFGNESPEVAESLTSLADGVGHLNGHLNELGEAETALREALRIHRKVFHGACPEVVRCLMLLGLVLSGRDNLDEGEALEREALAMSRELWGNENPEAATLLGRLAGVCRSRGNDAEADIMDGQALAMRRKLLGNDHPYVAISLANFAGSLLLRNLLDEAEPKMRDCLSIREKKMPGRWETFHTRVGLGRILLRQGKYAEAEPLLASGCEGMQQRLDSSGPWGRDVLKQAIGDLILLYGITGQRDQAAHWKKEVVKQYREEMEHSGSFADAYAVNEIAWFLATSEEPEIRDGPRAVQLAERAVAATSRTNSMILDTLAAAYAESGQFQKAVSVQKEAMALLKSETGKADCASRLQLYSANKPYHRPGPEERVADLLAQTATYLLQARKFAEAEKRARECLAIREREVPDTWLTFNTRSVLGGSLLGQKNYRDAEPLLLSGYEGLKQREDKIPAAARPRLVEAVQRLVQLYEAKGQSDKAAEWKQKQGMFD